MKQSLQLKIGQQLAMTPQLQQAIRLLQLSALDLTAEIQENLESNPMLEIDEEGHEQEGEKGQEVSGEGEHERVNGTELREEQMVSAPDAETAADSAMEMNGTSEDMPVDSSWEDVYESILPPSSSAQAGEGDDRDLDAMNSPDTSLRDHLMWQLQMTSVSDRDRSIAMAIIDDIDERGYLTTPLEEIRADVSGDDEIGMDEVMAVLHLVQNFDPVGVAACDLAECLHLQLQQKPADTPWLRQTCELVRNHLDLVGRRDYKTLMSKLGCDEEGLRGMLNLLQTLNPAPGEQIASPKTEYIVPDVYVFKGNGAWRVELNLEAIPRIRINSSYASLVRQVESPSDNEYMRQQLQEARWFVKSIQSRNETLLRVARFIVDFQQNYFEFGEEAMRPMVLADVAEAVEMHESTISRVTTRKYMHTPRGILELKYFFSSHVSTSSGGECSATAIRAVIKKLIAAEDSRKPLSDSKITAMLRAQGINVARRTVAKYREAMSIPTSSERRQML
ncbi:MAG: RNA polymerase factor sigma-54 [Gammaproteobacteria bacterium]|nr:RNA polymerase factor sigma-54 [Gammaproteobacteria bacterium]